MCLMFVGPLNVNSNDLWSGLRGPPAGFAIGIQNVLYGCVGVFRRHIYPGDRPNAKPFIAGGSSGVTVASQNLSALLLPRLRVADLQSLTRSSTMLTAQTDYVVPVSFRTNSASKRGWSVARACSLPVSKPEGQPGDLGAILG